MGAAENLLQLSVSCQNCNSLNLTTSMQSYDIKIAALKALNTDIILLCDTRLVSNKGIKGVQRLKNSCRDARGKSYDVFVNSNSNSRGVAILAATELNLSAINTHIDPEENFIFVHTHYLGHELLLGAIYGPNNTSRDFYRRISHVISQYSHCKIILGGDWNTVWDSAPLHHNIDVYKMAALPNPKNSELLKNMAQNYNLVDPFRVLHPFVNSYTYTPFGPSRKNRSRLDFFVISENVLPSLLNCENSNTPSTRLFDHKSVSLYLGPVNTTHNKKVTKTKLRSSGLSDPILSHKVFLSAYKAHLHSLNTNHTCEILGPISTYSRNMQNSLKQIDNLLNEYIELRKTECGGGGQTCSLCKFRKKTRKFSLDLTRLLI